MEPSFLMNEATLLIGLTIFTEGNSSFSAALLVSITFERNTQQYIVPLFIPAIVCAIISATAFLAVCLFFHANVVQPEALEQGTILLMNLVFLAIFMLDLIKELPKHFSSMPKIGTSSKFAKSFSALLVPACEPMCYRASANFSQSSFLLEQRR